MDNQDPNNSNPPAETPEPDEAAERQAHTEFLRSVVSPKRKRGYSKVLAIIIVLLLLVGGGAYWKFVLHKAKPAKHTTTTSTTSPTAPANVPTKQDTSTNFNLSFNYPQTWTVTDSGNGQLTVVSPPTPLTGSDGQAITGQITLTVRAQGQGLDAFAKGNGLAVLASQKVSYSSPTQTQRAQTYLTYVQYPTTTVATALDAIYITGDFGYQKAQAVPQVDLGNVDPQVVVTFAKCSTATCSTVVPTNIAAASWKGNIATTTETMMKSFSFD